jgi:hypothetical protein
MENSNLPGTLSPCVRIFLEMLCRESNDEASAESRVFIFNQAVAQPQKSADAAFELGQP